MTGRLASDVRAVLARVPHWRGRDDLVVSALAGGQSNRALRVATGGEEFVLRIRPLVGPWPDPRVELAAHRTASAAGLAPEVVFADPAAGLLVTRFVPGPSFGRDDLRRRAGLARFARLLDALRGLPAPPAMFRPVAAADAYWAWYRARRTPDATEAAMRARFVDEGASLAADLSHRHFCHHDLIGGNVIDSGRLMVLDFEYAAAGDPRMELAMVACTEDLDDGQTARLAAACHLDAAVQAPALRRLRRLADYLAAHWYLARSIDPDRCGTVHRPAGLFARLVRS